MKPASFKYLAPNSAEEALTLLARHGNSAKILAGGQSLVPILNFRLGAYDYLIDINRAKDLAYIRVADGWLNIGPLTRQREIETSALVREAGWQVDELEQSYLPGPAISRPWVHGTRLLAS